MATTYTVTNSFTADTTAVASQVNANFTDILTALNAFDAGNLSSGTVALARISGLTTSQLAAATLVTEAEGISSNDNDTTLPSSAAVKDYTDTAVAAVIAGRAKGWVTFDGDTSDTATVKDSYNVDSVVRNSEGNYTITWTTDFANVNYAILFRGKTTAGLGDQGYVDSRAVGSCTIKTLTPAGALIDSTWVDLVAFGDQ